MKRYRILYMSMMAAVAAACAPTEEVEFGVDTGFKDGPIKMGPAGGIQTIKVTAPGDWVVITEEPWITVSPANGRGAAECQVSVDSTLVVAERTGAANPYEWTPQFSTDEEWEAYNVLERKALDYFVHHAGSPDGVIDGGLVFFAGGNEAAPAASYPGAYPDFVAVAATAGDFTPAVYSNYGPGTTISAPGGDQDYYWEYADDAHKVGEIGCILSTLPKHISESGYGYMEGTSMACPHVSGVAALGLSYAAQLRRHFTADEFKELLHTTATPIDQYMSGPKQYKKYVIDLFESAPLMTINLNDFKGGMGSGQVNAYALLKAIEGTGVEMTFPNLYVAVGGQSTVDPSMYMDGTSFSVSVSDQSVATAQIVDGKMVVKGLKTGQTEAAVTGSRTDKFVITVRETANGNGWL